ncbi:MAG: molybdopterin-guanine dinucleotide biosynthesis protein B [Lautropia sp.]
MRVIGFAGFSGAGKTTLIEQLIPRLVARGLRVSLVKHAHHAFDIDQPGKDSYRHRQAGASEILLTSSYRWALMHELRGAPEPSLHEQLRRFSPCDLVLVEGFKSAEIPKIEVHRPSLGRPLLQPQDPYIIAIASDEPIAAAVPRLDLADRDAIAAFILAQARLVPSLDGGPAADGPAAES